MQERSCPECERELIPIQMIDQMGHGNTAVGFPYTVDQSPRTSAWSGKVKNKAGVVHAMMCTECSRVLLYAHPGE